MSLHHSVPPCFPVWTFSANLVLRLSVPMTASVLLATITSHCIGFLASTSGCVKAQALNCWRFIFYFSLHFTISRFISCVSEQRGPYNMQTIWRLFLEKHGFSRFSFKWKEAHLVNFFEVFLQQQYRTWNSELCNISFRRSIWLFGRVRSQLCLWLWSRLRSHHMVGLFFFRAVWTTFSCAESFSWVEFWGPEECVLNTEKSVAPNLHWDTLFLCAQNEELGY